jgi:hypothetical protein
LKGKTGRRIEGPLREEFPRDKKQESGVRRGEFRAAKRLKWT